MKRKRFFLISLIAIYLVIEGAAYVVMDLIGKNPDPRVTAPIKCNLTKAQRDSIPIFLSGKSALVFHKDIGWLHPDPLHVRTNRRISLTAGADQFRIASFGDSFTHGDGVNPEEAFPEILNSMDPRLDSLNLGVSRFGLDQAYLNYLESGVPLKPRVVLICFMPENILRQVNVFRPFYAQGDIPPLTKPRFFVRNHKLILRPNPFQSADDYNELLKDERQTLAKLRRDDFFAANYKWDDSWEFTPAMLLVQHVIYTARRKIRLKEIMTKLQYRGDSEALEITSSLMEEFSIAVKAHGGEPIVVILPRYQDLWVYVQTGNSYYAPLLDELKKRSLPYVDGQEAFSPLLARNMSRDAFDTFQKTYFTPGEHYSPSGHRLIAQLLFQRVVEPRLGK